MIYNRFLQFGPKTPGVVRDTFELLLQPAQAFLIINDAYSTICMGAATFNLIKNKRNNRSLEALINRNIYH